MTDIAQQIALCEWAYPKPLFQWRIENGRIVCEAHHDDGKVVPCQTPNTDSLDVLQEMAQRMTIAQKVKYADILAEMAISKGKEYTPFDFCCATAEPRREVLLRLLGLWKE